MLFRSIWNVLDDLVLRIVLPPWLAITELTEQKIANRQSHSSVGKIQKKTLVLSVIIATSSLDGADMFLICTYRLFLWPISTISFLDFSDISFILSLPALSRGSEDFGYD